MKSSIINTLASIQQQEIGSTKKVLLVTSLSQSNGLGTAHNANASSYLTNPIPNGKILNTNTRNFETIEMGVNDRYLFNNEDYHGHQLSFAYNAPYECYQVTVAQGGKGTARWITGEPLNDAAIVDINRALELETFDEVWLYSNVWESNTGDGKGSLYLPQWMDGFQNIENNTIKFDGVILGMVNPISSAYYLNLVEGPLIQQAQDNIKYLLGDRCYLLDLNSLLVNYKPYWNDVGGDIHYNAESMEIIGQELVNIIY